MKRYKLTIENIDEQDTLVIVRMVGRLFIEMNKAHDAYDFFVESGITLIEGEHEKFYYPMHYYGEHIEEAFRLENCVYLGWDYKVIEVVELN